MEGEEKRLWAWGFCVMSVPAVLILPGQGWLWAFSGALGAALLLWGLLGLRRRLEGELIPLAARRKVGKLLMFLLLLWNYGALGAGARQLCLSFPTAEQTPLPGLLLLLLGAYAADKKRVAEAAAVCFLFLLGLYGLLLGLSLPDLQPAYLQPERTAPPAALSAALAPLLLIYFHGGRGRRYPLAGGVIFTLLAALVTVGSLSPQVARQLEFPFYEAAKNVTLLRTIQHLEPLVSAGLCVGGFCLLGLICAVNEEVTAALLPQKIFLAAPANFLLGTASFFLTAQVGGGVFAAGTTIFWGILPFALLFLVLRKKSQKF